MAQCINRELYQRFFDRMALSELFWEDDGGFSDQRPLNISV